MADPLFQTWDDHFTFEVKGVTLTVDRLQLPGYVVFRVVFSSNRKPITIARAVDSNTKKFWTSIPEGGNREREAQGVGKLIEDYFKEKETQ